MKNLLLSVALQVVCMTAMAGSAFSVSETKISDLMENPEARAILEKYMPETVSNPQFSMASGFTLKFVAGFDSSGELNEENLKRIDEELAKLDAE